MRVFFFITIVGLFFWSISLRAQYTNLPIDTAILIEVEDSIKQAKDSVAVLSPSIYDTLTRVVLEDLPLDSLKQQLDIQPIKRSSNDHLPFYVLLFIVGIFGYVRFNFFSYLQSVQQSFFNINLTQQFFEEHFYSVSPASFFLNLNLVLIYSLLAYLAVRYFGKLPHIGDMSLAGIILVSMLGISLSRYWAYRITAYILPVEKTLLFYLFNIRIINYALGMVLIPFLFILAFADNMYLEGTIWGILIVVWTFVLYRCYRGLLIGEQIMKFNKFHFFIYLCTFEIAPILILYKIVEILIV